MLIISDVTVSPKTPGEPNGATPAPLGVTESEPACGSPVEGAVLSLPPSCAPLLRPPLPQPVQRTFFLRRPQTQQRCRHNTGTREHPDSPTPATVPERFSMRKASLSKVNFCPTPAVSVRPTPQDLDLGFSNPLPSTNKTL